MNTEYIRIKTALARLGREVFLSKLGFVLLSLASGLIFIFFLSEVPARLGKGALIWAIFFWGYVLFSLLFLGIWVWKNKINIEKIALVCERAFPELGDGLISLVQLGREVEQEKHNFSLTFFEKHLEQVAEKFWNLPLKNLLALSRLKKAGAVFVLLAGSWLGAHFLISGFGEGVRSAFLLSSLLSSAPKGFLQKSKALELYDFKIEYHYPAYSGLEPKEVNSSNGELSALVGTVAEIQAKSPVLLKRVWVELEGKDKLKAQVKSDLVIASITITGSGRWRFAGVDKEGTLWSEPEYHSIFAFPDNPPKINLTEPKAQLEVRQDDRIKLKFQASDDFGLESIWLVFKGSGDEKERRIKLAFYQPAPLELNEEFEWNLKEFDFAPGERVAYYLEAQDNNHATGPGVGRSETRYIEIFSPLKRHLQIIAKEQELFEELIGFLDKNIIQNITKLPEKDFWQKEQAMIEDFKKIKTMLAQLSKKIKEDELSPALIKAAISQGISAYENLITSRRKMALAKNRKGTFSLINKTIVRMEKDILFWDAQLKKQRLDYLLALAEKLRAGQEELARLLEKYEQTKDLALLDKIEAKLAELKQLYEEYLSRLGELAQTLPDEFVNLDAIEKMSAGDVYEKLEEFRRAIHDRDIESALAHAQDFLSSLDQLLGELNKQAEEFGEKMNAEILASLDKALDKIRQLKQSQKSLIELTEPIYQNWLQAQKQAEKELDKKIDEIAEQMDELRNSLQKQSQKVGEFYASPELSPEASRDFYRKRARLGSRSWQMVYKVGEAKKFLKQKKLDKASGSMQRLIDELEDYQKSLKDFLQSARENEEKKKEFMNSCQGARGLAKKIKDEIDQLIKSLSPSLSEQDSEKLANLSKEQAELRQKTDELRSELKQAFENLSVSPQKAISHLESASFKMRDAQGELELKNPDLALMAEKEAKYWLEQAEKKLADFRRQLKKSSKPSGIGALLPWQGAQPGKGEQGAYGTMSKDFEIPSSDKEKMGLELKKKILKAMQEGSPKGYEELNRDYYKRLIQ